MKTDESGIIRRKVDENKLELKTILVYLGIHERRCNMKLSARNQLNGKVVEIQKGQVNAKVTLETAGGERLTSIISLDAAEELELAKGKEVIAVIKSSSILLMTE